jgi:phosphoribosylamine--glycine ligase
MLTCDGPKVIEFNVRFGDPEAQVVIPMTADDLAPRLAAAADGSLDDAPLRFRPERHVGVVLASEGYPAPGPMGLPITGLDTAGRLNDVLVFHAGTARRGNEVVTAGGRVLTVVGRGATYEEAIRRAYAGVAKISFNGMHYRRDIGRKALEEGKREKG